MTVLFKRVFVIVLSLIALCLFYFTPLSYIENKVYDCLMILRQVFFPDNVEKIVVIIIDDHSVQEAGGWPLSRDYYHKMLSRLQEEGAAVIGLDVILSARYNKGDEELAGLFADYNNIVLPSVLEFKITRGLSEEIEVIDIEKPPALFNAQVETGHINFIPDRDGIIRSLYPSIEAEEGSYPAFTVRMAELAGVDLSALSKQSRIYPNFIGSGHQIFPEISMTDLLHGNYQEDYFTDKFVLIGTHLAGLGDLYMTPFSAYGYLYGVEIHGQVLHSLLQKNYLSFMPVQGNFFILVFLILISLTTFFRKKPAESRFYFFIFIGVYLITALYLFYQHYFYINILIPLLLISLVYAGSFLYWYLFSERYGKELVKLFSRYLSPAVLQEIQQNPEKVKLGGVKVNVTVLFIDIRKFTAYTEGRGSVEVVDQLNDFFSEVCDVIFQYQGTLDKYLGDGLMAFFGSPLAVPEHSTAAVRAAREIMNLSFSFKLGIGINTGSVIAGNIGSSKRMDYTIIGDAVNLAARFVDIAAAGEIIIGQNSFRTLNSQEKEGFIRNEMEIRGLKEKVIIYKLLNGGHKQ
ncbi:MAG: adenylate/guanylate cyclase domain-containing protein [Firmicutes bacterium]|nr:adenylate/guanylate cyclase domain-containing protein [Bacillota bacterium]